MFRFLTLLSFAACLCLCSVVSVQSAQRAVRAERSPHGPAQAAPAVEPPATSEMAQSAAPSQDAKPDGTAPDGPSARVGQAAPDATTPTANETARPDNTTLVLPVETRQPRERQGGGGSRQPWSLPIAQLGYERDIVLASATPSVSFSFPLPAAADLAGATLEVRLRLAKTDIPFVLTVNVEGEPVFSGSVPTDGLTHTLTVPVRASLRQPGSRSLYVEMAGAYRPGGGTCLDAATAGLFAVVENNTALHAAIAAGTPATIAGFFDAANTAYRLVPTGQEPAQAETCLRLASLLGSLDRQGLTRSLDVGPVDPARRNIVIDPSGQGSDAAAVDGDILRLTPGGARTLTSSVLPLLVVRAIKPVPHPAAGLTPPDPGKSAVSLAQLGLTKAMVVRGHGNLPVTFTFFLSDLDGMHESTQLTLRYNNSPVTEAAGAFLLVYLNDVLVGSRTLGQNVEPQSFAMSLPRQYLAPINTVRVVFAAPPCASAHGGPAFEGAVLPDSMLEARTPVAPRNLTIALASALLRSKGEVAVDEGGPGLAAMAGLVKSLTYCNGRTLDFTFAPDTAAAQPKREGTGQAAGPAWRLLGLSPRDLVASKPIVDVSRGFTITNPRTGQRLVDGETEDGIVVLQAFFDERNTPCIALTASKLGLSIAPEMLTWEKLRGLGGNVAVLDGDHWVSLTVGEVLEVHYADAVTLEALWQRYRLFVVIGLGALVLAILASWWRISAGRASREKSD